MALFECPECGKLISEKTDLCIGCGFPVQKFIAPIREQYREFLEVGGDYCELEKIVNSFRENFGTNNDSLLASIFFNETKQYLMAKNEDAYKSFMVNGGLEEIIRENDIFFYEDLDDDYEKYKHYWNEKLGNTSIERMAWRYMRIFLFCGLGCERDLDSALRIDSVLGFHNPPLEFSLEMAEMFKNDNPYAKYLLASYFFEDYNYYQRCDPYFEVSDDEVQENENLMGQAANEGCIEAKYWLIKQDEEELEDVKCGIYDLGAKPVYDVIGVPQAITDEICKQLRGLDNDKKSIVNRYQQLVDDGNIEYAYVLDKFIRKWFGRLSQDKSILYCIKGDEIVESEFKIEDIVERIKYIPKFDF